MELSYLILLALHAMALVLSIVLGGKSVKGRAFMAFVVFLSSASALYNTFMKLYKP